MLPQNDLNLLPHYRLGKMYCRGHAFGDTNEKCLTVYRKHNTNLIVKVAHSSSIIMVYCNTKHGNK